MYAARLGRFVNRDPVAYAAGVNLVEYVWDSPANWADPFGLQKLPLPTAPPGTISLPINNAPMKWYRRPYGFAPTFGVIPKRFLIPQKPRIIKKFGKVTPFEEPVAHKGISMGKHRIGFRPLPPNSRLGPAGCGPCIGVVVVCTSHVIAFHFGQGDDAGATLGQYSWPNGCSAVICGGNNTHVSNDQLIEVINALQQEGIEVTGIANWEACFFGPGAGWCVGKTDKTCQDDSEEGE